ncbi:hypothetical protein ACFL6S_36830, partial [Candidatus Poribacteria bacterium]
VLMKEKASSKIKPTEKVYKAFYYSKAKTSHYIGRKPIQRVITLCFIDRTDDLHHLASVKHDCMFIR